MILEEVLLEALSLLRGSVEICCSDKCFSLDINFIKCFYKVKVIFVFNDKVTFYYKVESLKCFKDLNKRLSRDC